MMKKLLLAALCALLVSACGFDEKTDVMFECVSPSGDLIATLYRVSTGKRPGDQGGLSGEGFYTWVFYGGETLLY